MATKAPAKCYIFKSRTGGYGDKSAGNMLLVKNPVPGVMATTTPAKCFFGSISKHNQGGRPTYVWMCVIVQSPEAGIWRQKRRPNVSLDLCRHTTNVADQRMYGCVYYIESRTGGYGDKSAGQMLLVKNPLPGVMATTAPAKCFFGSISKHNQGDRPTYVWMCVLYGVPKRGFWRQKRRPNVTCKESCAGGYGDNSAGKMFLRIYFQTHPRRQTNICMDVCNCAKS